MKYYVYVSKSKLDVLYPQIREHSNRKTSTETKIDLKFFSSTTKTESEVDTMTKLREVSEFIETFGNLGTIEEPSEYIKDVVTVKMFTEHEANFLFFGGYHLETVVGLGGSSSNLISQAVPNDWDESTADASMMPKIEEMLRTGQMKKIERQFRETKRTEKDILESIYHFISYLDGYPMKVEFIAKTLIYEQNITVDDHWTGNILLATPIYVARYHAPTTISLKPLVPKRHLPL